MSIDIQSSNPYVGLRPFGQEDSLYFFGRREQTTELLEQLHRSPFLTVVGSSGCGKSSLIRAGLIPALLGGFLVEERDQWRVAEMKPGDAPLRNLAAALVKVDEAPPTDEAADELWRQLDEAHTEAAIKYLMPRLGRATNLLLLIDQFEEIFSFRGTEDEDQLAEYDRERRQERAQHRAEAADFVDLLLDFKDQTDLHISPLRKGRLFVRNLANMLLFDAEIHHR